MGVPLAALNIRPPAQPDNPVDTYARVLQIKQMQQEAPLRQQAMQQQVALGQADLQQKQYALGAQQALSRSYQNAIKPDSSGIPQIDSNELSKSLANSGYGAEIPGVLEGINKFNKSMVDLQDSQNKLKTQSLDLIGGAASAIQASKYNPQLAHTILDAFPDSPQIQRLRQTVDNNPEAFKQLIDSSVAQSPEQQKLANERAVATIRASKPPEGELPLPNVPQMNQALATRYQVLNPGKALPAQFTLPANATQKDYDRIDKALEATERATGTKAQQDLVNQQRADAAADRKEKQEASMEEKGRQPVTGTDAEGHSVLVPASEAKDLSNVMKADADIVNKSTAARHWLTLADKPGSENGPSQNMGITQLIDKLDKEGKLGAITSRWNDFLSGKIGAGDPDYTALRAKMGLSATKLMQAHVGSRGGAFMMEHFEDLANAKKMDAANLKAGFNSERDYMNDVAMLPKSMRQQTAKPAGAGVPSNVSKALANTGPGIHRLSDGSTWMKAADGTITKQ